MARILIVEDDPKLGPILKHLLEDAGHEVVLARNGITGLIRLREEAPELVVLDLGLPDLDGAEVLIRTRVTEDIPVLVLTATADLERKVALLREGADDYLTKPFYPEELLARIGALLRRRQRIWRFGELTLDPLERKARFRGQDLALTPKEFELLSLLVRRPGRIYAKEEIAAQLWPENPPSSNAVEVHVAKLRKKLERAGARRLLRTVRGRGYALTED